MPNSASTVPFSFSTVTDFDDHIANEIRGYRTLSRIVEGIADTVIETDTCVHDIGCSTGRLINVFAKAIDAETDPARRRNVKFFGYEPNENFVSVFRPATPSVQVLPAKVTASTKFDNASLITSLFTLQFLPMTERHAIIHNVYDGLNIGGAFILAEKVYAQDTEIDRLLTDQHLDFKSEHNEPAAILDKSRRLRAIMRPTTLEHNIRMLTTAGFTRLETFWRVNNFVAVLCLKA